LYLSGLEILGFKSFPLKTSVEFAAGITGVVGPNGCGKTNVLDAIRWVLGEQRISILRGGKMEDVIFAGTREMKPLGMAEVALHIVNNRGVLPTEYNNLTITRRLHRSGDSEYLLNNVSCRLKDINDLFADTGMGAHAYSVIELDMVEAILSDKADQRRMLFEEAAGITKYKHRKKAALRKLEATEQDLLRLLDILSEVSTQVNSLSRQMKKAERYKYYEDRVKTVGQVILKEKYRRLHGQLQSVRDEKRLSQIKLAELSGEIDRWELAREDYAAKSLELSEQLREIRQKVEEVSSNCYRLESEISVTEERIHSADVSEQNDQRDIENLKIKIEQLAQEKVSLLSKKESLQSSLAEAHADLQAREATLNAKIAELDQARNSTQSQQRDLFEIEGKKNLSEQTRTQLGQQIEDLRVQIEKIREREALLTTENEECVRKLAIVEERQQKSRDEIAFLEESTTALSTERDETTARLAELQTTLNTKSVQLNTVQAQAELLSRMMAHYEGYGSGVTSIFSNHEEIPGVIDTAANLIRVQPEYTAAIETAMGDAAEYIVVEDRKAAHQAITHLRANKRGRATFIIKSELDSWSKDHKLARPGGFGGNLVHASEVISAVPGYEKLADLLLGDVLIVNEQNSAEKLIELGQGDFRVVTLDGHYYPARQIHTGGGDKQVPLLGRESDLTRLKVEIEELTGVTESTRSEIERWGLHKTQIESNLTDAARQVSQLRNTAAELQIEQASHKLRVQQIVDLHREFGTETERLNEKSQNLRSQLEALEGDVTRLAADSEGRLMSLQSQQSTVEALQHDVNSAAQQVEELRLRGIRQQTELNSLENNLQRIDELTTEMHSQREYRIRTCEARVIEIAGLRERIADCRRQLEEKAGERESLRSEELALTSKQGELSEKQSEFDQILKANRRQREELNNQNQTLLVQETELNARHEDVIGQLRELYDIDVISIVMPEPLADETFHELEAELQDCRSKQQQIGMVNMLALEEYERESERERFLRGQIDDLTRAKDDLKSTITRINTTARKMFSETFVQVRTNFQQVFAELFQGGEADLRLENEEDPLESPVQISARPRGKRFLNITQLSGGEKALTAISLLFAIYLVKPSPFCILDEVDAPLDDANVMRFLRMVRSFIGKTQFIIITHNKRTMEQCDRLYGVTMQQPGVSQIVSVDFEGKGRRTELEVMKFTGQEAKSVEPEPQPEPVLAMTAFDEELGAEFDEPVGKTEKAIETRPAAGESTLGGPEDDEEYDEDDDDEYEDDDDDDEDDD